jgi:hypothetical protein
LLVIAISAAREFLLNTTESRPMTRRALCETRDLDSVHISLPFSSSRAGTGMPYAGLVGYPRSTCQLPWDASRPSRPKQFAKPSPPTTPTIESTNTRHSSRRGHSAQTLDGSAATPAGRPLANPLAGSLPPFVNGISKHPRPIVTTGIRLFTGHAFSGEYTARFLPRSFDCQCVELLQKARHVIAACPLLAEHRR